MSRDEAPAPEWSLDRIVDRLDDVEAAVLSASDLRDRFAVAALEQARSTTMTNAQLAVRAYKTADALLRVREGAVLCLDCEGFGYVNAAVNGMHEPRRVERLDCPECGGTGLVRAKP